MTRFSDYTLTQVGGPTGQVIVQELTYGQKDFWTIDWISQTTSDNGWDTNTVPVNLTNATITAQIIRRSVTAQKDTRCGLDLTLADYPTPSFLTTATLTVAGDDTMTVNSTSKLFVNQPIRFRGSTFGNVAINTTYYVKTVPTETTFSLSTSTGGATFDLTAGSGSMQVVGAAPTAINLPITNVSSSTGSFNVTIDVDNWGLQAGDPELDISATYPIAYSGLLRISFPADGNQPAYDDTVYLLFTVESNGVTN